MSRSPIVERFLDNQKVPYEYQEDVPLEKFDEYLSLRNQARFTQVRDPELVEQYASMMREGADFPALVSWAGPKGLVLIDGNHRIAAARMAGLSAFGNYLVASTNPEIIEGLTRSFNTTNGVRPSSDDIMEHARTMMQRYSMSQVDVAKMLHINARKLGNYTSLCIITDRLNAISLGNLKFDKSAALRLGGITLDTVLYDAATLAHESGMTIEAIGNLVKEISKSRTESEQRQVVRRWGESPEIQNLIILRQRGRKPSGKALPYERVQQFMSAVKTAAEHLKQYLTVNTMTPEAIKEMEEAYFQTNIAVEAAIGIARSQQAKS